MTKTVTKAKKKPTVSKTPATKAQTKTSVKAKAKVPEKVQTKAPVNTQAKAPEKVQTNTPAKAQAKAPEKVQTKAPAKAQAKAPEKVQTKAPAKAQAKAPEKVKTKAPAKAQTKAPEKVQTKAPAKAQAKAPEKVQTKAPAKAQAKAPEKVQTKAPLKPAHRNEQIPALMNAPDPIAFGHMLGEVIERGQPVFQKYFEKLAQSELDEKTLDPYHLRDTCIDFWQGLMKDPEKLAQLQMEYWREWSKICQESTLKFLGGEGKALYNPERGDRRFKDPVWQESVIFDFIKQSYLLTSDWMQKLVLNTKGLSKKEQKKLGFYTKQFVDAMAPNNFIMTNPEVLRTTLETGGENLIRGLENLVADLERGAGELKISKTDYNAFKVGKNLAITPGKVIFQNDLIQLIQYTPTTKQVHDVPLLIVPPWINKYYILDLREKNSFIKWAVDQGFTVFTISWVNPDAKLAMKSFADYMDEGILTALDQVEKLTGTKKTNVIGYCIGGTLLTTTLAWLSAKGQDNRIGSATFLTTLIDFTDPGDMGIFIDDEQLQDMEDEMKEKGYFDASALKETFSMLRSNDMIWSFVVNNYLLGRDPFPFDILYWNDDSTNMPAEIHRFYLRNMYKDNRLIQPGGITIKDVPINTAKIKIPTYFLSTEKDHIVPWESTYRGAQRLTGSSSTFTLAASGHVAGVINPPAAEKYCYWSTDNTDQSPENFRKDAKKVDGSWWPHWADWLKQYSGKMVDAREEGCGKAKPIEDAPGSYVKAQAD